MTKEEVFEKFTFLDSDNILHQDQLDTYAEWVIDALEYDNVIQILDYLKDYNVGDISDFFLYELGVFLYPFEERFIPIWEKLFQELGAEYDEKIIEGEIVVENEFARIEKELFGRL